MKKSAAIAIAIILISAGAAASAQTGPSAAKASIDKGIQYVAVDVGPRSYGTIVVQKGMPVRFNLRAARGSLNGCNGAIQVPAFGIRKRLAVGDNIVEFTPKASGTLPYACWMGMIRSNIVVVDDLSAWGKK